MKIKLSEKELVQRYKDQYCIPEDIDISIDQVNKHWELEKKLTKKLLNSTNKERWEIFDYCYSTLYKELPWLNLYSETNHSILSVEEQYSVFVNFIGKIPKKIYEVGSGQGVLISYLASLGHHCRATEITRERGEKLIDANSNISWAISDGIHLDSFEEKNSYDIIISNMVIEHMHPDDLCNHFKGAYEILKKDGKYLFSTPHKFYGPTDITNVFKLHKPMGMHLKEYMVYELARELRKAGFSKISFPNKIFKKKVYKYFPFAKYEFLWVFLYERTLDVFPIWCVRKLLSFVRKLLYMPTIYIVAEK